MKSRFFSTPSSSDNSPALKRWAIIRSTGAKHTRGERLSIFHTTLANPWKLRDFLVIQPSRIMEADPIRVERATTDSKLFAHTRWDAVPALASLFHLAYFFALFFLYPRTPLWVMLILGFVYALMINANINGIGHNFIHNPFFRSPLLNRLFGVAQSIAC